MKKIIPNTQKTVSNILGTYKRAMETKEFVYFVKFDESDESGSVKMYRKQEDHLELVSDNYFAFVGIMDDLRAGNETWMSPQMKKNRKIQIEAEIVPLVKEYVELSKKGDTSCFTEDGQRFNFLEEEIEELVDLPEHDVCSFLEGKFAEYL